MESQDWIESAHRLFAVPKPEHFTNYTHCCECAEHDETLIGKDVHSIGMDELGNPGWDPLSFCSGEGMLYYTPALIRLSFETLNGDFYFADLLFHLEYLGEENRYLKACNRRQREFIAGFVNHMILNHPDKLDQTGDPDAALRVAELWTTP